MKLTKLSELCRGDFIIDAEVSDRGEAWFVLEVDQFSVKVFQLSACKIFRFDQQQFFGEHDEHGIESEFLVRNACK